MGKRLFHKLGKGGVAAAAVVAAGASQADAAWTVDLTAITTDVTAIGTSLLALAVVIFGFRVARRMVGR